MLVSLDGDPSEIFPLDRCQGDCDSDSECLPGLICYQRVAFEAVPGCFGAEQDSSRTDYCILPPVATFMPVTTPAPVSGTITARPTARPTQNQSPKMVRVVGDNGPPSNVFPLGICEGDCDDDDDVSSFCKKGIEGEFYQIMSLVSELTNTFLMLP